MRQGLDFLRWGWRHHRAITVTWMLCTVVVGAAGLAREVTGDRSAWPSTLFVLGIVGAFTCWVILVRREDD